MAKHKLEQQLTDTLVGLLDVDNMRMEFNMDDVDVPEVSLENVFRKYNGKEVSITIRTKE